MVAVEFVENKLNNFQFWKMFYYTEINIIEFNKQFYKFLERNAWKSSYVNDSILVKLIPKYLDW